MSDKKEGAPKRQSRYIKTEGSGQSVAVNPLLLMDTVQQRNIGSLRNAGSNMGIAPMGMNAPMAPRFTPNVNAASKVAPDNSKLLRDMEQQKYRPKPTRKNLQPRAPRQYEQVGLVANDDIFDEDINAMDVDSEQREKIKLEKQKQKLKKKRSDPFSDNKNPPIQLPFRDDIVDQAKDYRPQMEKTLREVDEEALKKQKELFKMDAIIADDELFFIQLPSSLPIDMDALRHNKNETAFQGVLNKMKVVRDDPSLTQDEKNSQLRELRVKLGQIKQEDTAREEKKTVISASIDQDENIWTVPFANTLTELKSGFVGTMQVYKSGKVKLKLGDVLFDVSPGTEFGFQEQVVHIDKDKKVCHTLGDIKAHLTCTPDIEYLLSKNKH